MPIELQAARARPAPASMRLSLPRLLPQREQFTGRDRMFFTERLALLLETGSPLHAGLEILEKQAARPPAQRMIRRLREDVSEGLSFSQALAKQPEVFSCTYVSLVAAAEGGGFLPEVLQRLREMDEKRQELHSALVAALSYPCFLALFSTAVVIFILTVVFPKFSQLFASIADQLPPTTVFLMATSDLLRQYWAPGLVAIAAAATVLWRWLKRPQGADSVDRLALRLPLIRDILVQLYVVQFMRVMSLSLANGVTMLDALRASREIVRSSVFRAFVSGLEERVTQGGALASGFQEARFLPSLVPQMITTGEETGNLAIVMGRVADFYEREWRKRLAIFSKIAEPAMLLIMGVLVGGIVSSLILPIFKLSRVVH